MNQQGQSTDVFQQIGKVLQPMQDHIDAVALECGSSPNAQRPDGPINLLRQDFVQLYNALPTEYQTKGDITAWAKQGVAAMGSTEASTTQRT